MKKVSILALERDIDRLIVGLGELGVLHLTPPAKDAEGKLLARGGREEELRRLQDLSHRVERLATMFGVPLDHRPPKVPEHFAAPEEVAGTLLRVEPQVDEVVRSREALTDEAADLRFLVGQMEAFEGTALSPLRMEEFSFVHFALGTMGSDRLDKVQSELGGRVLLVPVKGAGGLTRLLAVTSKRSRWELDAALQKQGFRPEEYKEALPGLPDEVLAGARKRLAEIVREDERLAKTLDGLAQEHGKLLRRFWRQLWLRQKIVHAHENLGRTQSTCLVSGWVPVTGVERLVAMVLGLTEHRAIIEIHSPDELGEEPPTSPRHPWFVRPFSLIVSGYGYPRYREIEPTVFVAVSFFLMFGAMFGDVGQGAVLLLGGLAVWRRVRKPEQKDFGMLIALCGFSAVLFGFVYGAVFGKEGLIPALWGSPMGKVQLLLQWSVMVGVVIISLGVVLNVVNKFRSGQWASVLFDRFGVAGIVFYWGALGLGVKYLLSGRVSSALAAAVILVPLVLIFLREPVRFALLRGGRKAPRWDRGAAGPDTQAEEELRGIGGLFVAVVEGGVEVLEALLLYVSNTASFMRVGAYALAHAGLCVVIFALGDAVALSTLGAVWSALLIVLGNAVVIVLEGLVVAVQVLRLEYYEFFGKFLTGEGRAYRPFDLKSEEL
jgi:V/A-type H+-transporting ATPase subunit I